MKKKTVLSNDDNGMLIGVKRGIQGQKLIVHSLFPFLHLQHRLSWDIVTQKPDMLHQQIYHFLMTTFAWQIRFQVECDIKMNPRREPFTLSVFSSLWRHLKSIEKVEQHSRLLPSIHLMSPRWKPEVQFRLFSLFHKTRNTFTAVRLSKRLGQVSISTSLAFMSSLNRGRITNRTTSYTFRTLGRAFYASQFNAGDH